MIETVYIPNAIAMVLLLVLVSANRVSRHALLLDSKIFILMIVCNFLQCVGEIIAYSIEGIMQPGFHALNLAVNSALYITNVMFSFLWVVYADYKIFEDVQRIKKRGKILILPALAVVLGSIVNLFTSVFFTVTEDNNYHRTALYLFPYLVTYFYLMYGTAFIYRHKSQARKYLFLPAVIFMIPIFLGSVIQFLFYGYSTVWIGVAIALVAVYVNVQNEMSYTDALSGLYTRTYMYQYLEIQLKKGFKEQLAGIMLDIDDFKKVNDTYGHLTGDDVIRSVGKILLNEMDNRSIGVRYGGDEFVVILKIQTENDIANMLERISKAEVHFNTSKGKKYSLHFSKGYSIFEPETDTVDSFLERMDAVMYEAKKTRKLHSDTR